MGNFLEKNVTEAGKGLNEYAAFHLMQDGHKSLNDLLFIVQEALDQKQNIHVKPQKAKFPEERARQAAQSLEDVTVPEETIRRRARSATSNILTSFQDDYIQENANFRTNAGLNCYVLRTGASKCCDWCAGVAGRYASKKAPNGFWRRHDNCTCQITYETQKSRQRLSGGSGKGWQVTDEVRRRQAQRIAYKPTKLTHEQAKELEQKNLSSLVQGGVPYGKQKQSANSRNNIDNSVQSDIIKSGIPYLDKTSRLLDRSIENCCRGTNPNYGKGEEYDVNCQRCVAAYEARRRGFNVIAKAAEIGDEPLKHTYGQNGWANIFENGEASLVSIDDSSTCEEAKGKISEKMKDYDNNNNNNGVRAIVKVNLKGSGAHVLNVEQVNGETKFIDPQDPTMGDCSFYFECEMISPKKFYF